MESEKSHPLKKRISVSKALIVFFMITGFILIVAVSISNYLQVTAAVRKERMDLSVHTVNEIQQAIKTFVTYRIKTLQDYSGFPILSQGVMQPESSRENLADFFDTLSILGSKTQFTLLDYKGSIIYSTYDYTNKDQATNSMVQLLISGDKKAYWGINQFKLKDLYHWRFAVPVQYNGMREGIFIGEIPIDDFEKDQNISTLLGNHQLKLVLDSNIIFSSGPELDTPPEIYQVEDSDIAMHFSWGYKLEDWKHKINLVYLSTLIIIVIGFCSFFTLYALIRRFISEPLALLRENSFKLAKEYSGVRFTENFFLKEIAQSADSFNNMADQIQNRVGELQDLKDSLELEVKQRTIEIRQEQERLAGILQGTNAGTWEWNIQTGETIFNIRWAEIIGYSLDEISPVSIETWRQFTHPDDLEKSNQLLQANFSGELDYYEYEARMKHKNGSWVWTLDRGKIVSWTKDNKPLMMMGTHQDISRTKETERQLKVSRDEAEAANRTKSEFLANMSHEIRTPLNAVLGFSDLLSSIVTHPKQKSYLESIHAAGKSLLTIINDILDLSKIEAGLLKIEYDYFNLRDVIHDIMIIFKHTCKEKKLKAVANIDPGLPTTLLLDEIRIRQVLLNLVGNAVKFTDSGMIQIKANFSVMKGNQTGNLIIQVKDSGIGIPLNEQKTIFDAFHQQDGQSNREFGGTGLGLTITKRLVDLMNGEIKVASKPKQGTIFSITLYDIKCSDLTPSNTDFENSENISNTVFDAASILVIDDIESNRLLIKEQLADTGLTILDSSSGYSGLELIKKNPPDLVLTDIRMPDMDGHQVLNSIKSNLKTQHIPVIAITASTATDDYKKSFSNFDGFLLKPLNKKLLIEEISKYIPYQQQSVSSKSMLLTNINAGKKIENASEILMIINQKFIPAFEEFQGALEMDSIKEFADQLSDLGAKYNVSLISDYADRLINSVDSFDILTTQNMIRQFSDIIKIIEEADNEK